MIVEAEGLIVAAARHGRLGRFQCEAAIQSVHAQRGVTGRLNLEALNTLYTLLVGLRPTAGSLTAYAAVRRQLRDPEGALSLLDRIDPGARSRYQPALLLEALLLEDAGQAEQARRARAAALALTTDPALRAHISAPVGERADSTRG